MFAAFVALLAALQGSAPAASAEEEPLITGAIESLRPHIPAPDAVRFRRVYLRRSTGMDGAQHTTLCGQVHLDDPRAPPGWVVFAAALIDGARHVYLGSRGLVNATVACGPSIGEWDYRRDFSPRFQAELGGR
jgi:hypothetical protein